MPNINLIKGKNFLIFLVLCVSVIIFSLIYFSKKNQDAFKNTKPIGEYRVMEQVSGDGADKKCKYKASYKEDIIDLGEYKSEVGCKTTQTVVANGMLAIAADYFTFFYDPVQKKVLKLDPKSLPAFNDYLQKNNINISNYQNRRYFLNDKSWRIFYQSNDSKYLIFYTQDSGNTFMFNEGSQL